MPSILKQCLLLLALSSCLGLVAGLVHPRAPQAPWQSVENAYSISLEDAAGLSLVLWVDARTKEEYNEAHIQGALLLNEDDWENGFFRLLENWTPEQTIVVYCDASECHASEAVAQRLRRELGVETVLYLEGGWQAWKKGRG